MNRWIGTLVLLCAAAVSLAQAPFTIVRPADGSRVREKVRILIPKNSIPRGGYVGFFIGGKFIEGTLPPLKGRYYEYVLDTKGRGIPDGKLSLEAVLYVDYNDEPRIVDRSSIEVTVANKANIPIPGGGLQLRYKFRPSSEYVYTVMQRVALSNFTARQASARNTADLPLDYEKVRMLYSVENTYGNGDALVRMQPLPTRGKEYAILTPTGDVQPKVYRETDMHPIYMRLTSTGNEVFGSVPMFVPFEGINSDVSNELFAVFPLPTLPTKRVRPGDVWQTRFQVGNVDLGSLHTQTSLVDTLPARGEFVGVEWEMGHPCAKIRHTIAANNSRRNGERVALEEVIWFALDKGAVIKMVRTQSLDTTEGQGGVANATPRPGAGSFRRPGQPTVEPDLMQVWPMSLSDTETQVLRQDEEALPPAMRRRPPFGQNPGGRINGNRGTIPANQQPATQVQRLTIQQIFVLEQ